MLCWKVQHSVHETTSGPPEVEEGAQATYLLKSPHCLIEFHSLPQIWGAERGGAEVPHKNVCTFYQKKVPQTASAVSVGCQGLSALAHYGHSKLWTHAVKVMRHCLNNSSHVKTPLKNTHYWMCTQFLPFITCAGALAYSFGHTPLR